MPAPLFDETRTSILSRRSNWAQMVERLDALELEKYELVQLCVIVSKQPIAQLFAHILRFGRGNFSLTQEPTPAGQFDVSQFHLRRELGRKFVRSIDR